MINIDFFFRWVPILEACVLHPPTWHKGGKEKMKLGVSIKVH